MKLREELNKLHAQFCSALSDPHRILILYLLAEGEKNVTELIESLNLSQPSVSRHLKILKDRKMVSSNRKGQQIYYQLKDERIIQALDILRTVMAKNLEEQSDLARAANRESE